jgi:hypothetical protein
MQQTSKHRVNRKPDYAAGVLIPGSRLKASATRHIPPFSYTASHAATHIIQQTIQCVITVLWR